MGAEVHTITRVDYGSTDAELDARFGLPKGDPVLVNYPAVGAVTSPATVAWDTAPTFVPSEAVPYIAVQCARFPVLSLPDNEWDRFVTTIYFGRELSQREREKLVKIIDAWLVLARYGGFEGRGLHSAKEVVFQDKTDSARIEADMGDTDPDLALTALIRCLEGFEEGDGAPIDAIVFGLGDSDIMDWN